jgi:uncharacterized protein (DUF952 family)
LEKSPATFSNGSNKIALIIYHITTNDTWTLSEGKDILGAVSLITEGFIHCSFREQVKPVLTRHFKGQVNLLLLQIESDLLTSELRVEPSTNNELYPHIYGVINKEAITGIERLT